MSSKILQIDYKKEKREGKKDENSILRMKAEYIKENEFGTKKLKEILDNMYILMKKENDSVAISAPQIGISKRIFILEEKAYKKNAKYKPLIFINPEIIKKSKKTHIVEEGCLSVRPLYGKIKRHNSVTIEARDFNGNKFSFGASGLIAQIFQHEYDHLNGVLFIDNAIEIKEIQELKENKNEKLEI